MQWLLLAHRILDGPTHKVEVDALIHCLLPACSVLDERPHVPLLWPRREESLVPRNTIGPHISLPLPIRIVDEQGCKSEGAVWTRRREWEVGLALEVDQCALQRHEERQSLVWRFPCDLEILFVQGSRHAEQAMVCTHEGGKGSRFDVK